MTLWGKDYYIAIDEKLRRMLRITSTEQSNYKKMSNIPDRYYAIEISSCVPLSNVLRKIGPSVAALKITPSSYIEGCNLEDIYRSNIRNLLINITYPNFMHVLRNITPSRIQQLMSLSNNHQPLLVDSITFYDSVEDIIPYVSMLQFNNVEMMDYTTPTPSTTKFLQRVKNKLTLRVSGQNSTIFDILSDVAIPHIQIATTCDVSIVALSYSNAISKNKNIKSITIFNYVGCIMDERIIHAFVANGSIKKITSSLKITFDHLKLLLRKEGESVIIELHLHLKDHDDVADEITRLFKQNTSIVYFPEIEIKFPQTTIYFTRNIALIWESTHARLTDIAICLLQFDINMPPYILLDIFDWSYVPTHPEINHRKKIELIFAIRASILKNELHY